jgi:hypothetical protein
MTTPQIMMIVKPRITSPPNSQSGTSATSVVSEVIMVRASVSLMLRSSSCSSGIVL